MTVPYLPPESAWSCWTSDPLPHPWLDIPDVNCGYHQRTTDKRCSGCHRQREAGPTEQLGAPRRDQA